MKCAIAVVIGNPRFKWQAGGSLLAVAAAGAASLVLL
jgi:hypothetical protein